MTPKFVAEPTARRIVSGEWMEPRYPGGSILQLDLERDGELGDVRVQWYGDSALMVASYTPGYETSSPGDTPKWNPDSCQWVENRRDAAAAFVGLVIAAFRMGWRVVTKR